MTKYQEILDRAQWEAEQNRPWDIQDRVVVGAALLSAVVMLLIMVWP